MKHNNLNSVILSALIFAGIAFGNAYAVGAASGASASKVPYKYFKMDPAVTAEDYLPKTIIFKVNPKYRQYCNEQGVEISRLNEFFQMLGGSVKKMYPVAKAPETKYSRAGEEMADLSLNYIITYTANVSMEDAVNYFYAQGNVIEFAQPHYVFKFLGTPNDANYSSQTFMTIIQAAAGWNTTHGNANTLIGIVDSGIDFNHQDLSTKIAYNPGEAPPLDKDGIDNDHDGYIDNYKGWDFGGMDNDPDYSTNQNTTVAGHGTFAAGLAAGATNNGIGIAGVSWDCKFLVVKGSIDQSGIMGYGYQGIVYAADHGVNIINCSWGSTPAPNYALQQAVDYCVINKNAAVIAGAGNAGINQDFYPASLDHVISVAATNSTNDQRAQFSNYSPNVDVCAPGANVYSTVAGNTYGTNSGTSFSTPIAVGVAALIKVMNPGYTAIQVGEHLKATTDDVYASNPNPTYKGKLGTGRVNMAKAVAAVTTPSVMMSSKVATDNNDDVFLIGDTIRYKCVFTNYLAATTGTTTAVLSLVTATPDVTILTSTATFSSSIAMMATVNNNAAPFKVKINSSALPNTIINFKLVTTNGTKVNTQYFSENINVDYLNIAVNDVSVSAPSNGCIGFVGENATGGGYGFVYNGMNVLFEGGLMVGVSPTQVFDRDRGTQAQRTYNDTDFVNQVTIKRVLPATQPANADWESTGIFNDNGTTAKVGITVDHREYAWSSAGNRKYVIFEYTIHNNSGAAFNNLYTGLFTDWDIDASVTNKNNFAGTDVTNRLGYTWRDSLSKVYAGTKLLSHNGGFFSYCLDNDSTSGGIPSNKGYSSALKYQMMSTNRLQAGIVKKGGNDVVNVVSTGPLTINSGSSKTIAFALMAGDNLADIQASATAAQSKYDGFTSITETSPLADDMLSQVYPNPSSSTATIEVNLQKNTLIELKVRDMLGHEVAVLANGSFASGQHHFVMDVSALPVGIYYYQLITPDGAVTKKMMIAK